MVRAEANAGDCLKNILNAGESRPTGEMEFMAWGAMLICLILFLYFFLDVSYYTERQFFVISFIADIRNWYLLHITLPSVFHFAYLIFGSSHQKLFLEIGVRQN